MLSKQSVSTTKGTMLTFIKFATKHFYDFPNWRLSSPWFIYTRKYLVLWIEKCK